MVIDCPNCKAKPSISRPPCCPTCNGYGDIYSAEYVKDTKVNWTLTAAGDGWWPVPKGNVYTADMVSITVTPDVHYIEIDLLITPKSHASSYKSLYCDSGILKCIQDYLSAPEFADIVKLVDYTEQGMNFSDLLSLEGSPVITSDHSDVGFDHSQAKYSQHYVDKYTTIIKAKGYHIGD